MKHTLDHTDFTILRTLEKQEMHGCELAAALEQQFDLTFSNREGMLYPTLMAMENMGLLEAFFKTSSTDTWRVHYSLTKKGRKHLQDAQWHAYPRPSAAADKAPTEAPGWFDAFCDQVLEHAPRTTQAEQEHLRGQLRAHLEDKEAFFRAKGYDDAAQDAAIAAMGSAAAIGAAINDQLSPSWLWVGRLAWMLRFFLAAALLAAAISIWNSNLWGNLEARRSDLSSVSASETDHQIWTAPLDERMELRHNIVRFHRIRLEQNDAGGYELILYMACYAKNPFANTPAVGSLQRITCSASDAPFTFDESTGFLSRDLRDGAAFWSMRTPVDRAEGTVTITVEHYGETFTMEAELGGAA